MTPTIAWISLIIAGITEVVWAYFLKQSDGLSKLLPSLCFVFFAFMSMFLLSLSIRILPLSISYPVWTALGAVGSVTIGVIIFHESINMIQFIFISMIILGVVGLKMTQF
jgi:quaternary ammonium compound-resistance protein SugE